MTDKGTAISALYIQQLDAVASSGNYAAQRQLDFRLEHGEPLRVVSPLTQWGFQSIHPNEEFDFQIAMRRRAEPEGSSLDQIGKKYGL